MLRRKKEYKKVPFSFSKFNPPKRFESAARTSIGQQMRPWYYILFPYTTIPYYVHGLHPNNNPARTHILSILFQSIYILFVFMNVKTSVRHPEYRRITCIGLVLRVWVPCTYVRVGYIYIRMHVPGLPTLEYSRQYYYLT